MKEVRKPKYMKKKKKKNPTNQPNKQTQKHKHRLRAEETVCWFR